VLKTVIVVLKGNKHCLRYQAVPLLVHHDRVLTVTNLFPLLLRLENRLLPLKSHALDQGALTFLMNNGTVAI
jgi:hypothetical protein